MNLDAKKIGNFIQACRKEAGITQSDMGERLCVSAQSVSNWERGETLPDISLLPDIATLLHCSVDTLLSGGCGGGGFRRHVTVVQMQEALSALDRIGELLGRDHFVYKCIIEALDKQMNTTIELSFSDPHIFDVFTIEFLLGCIDNGDYVDPNDVATHLPPSGARDYVVNVLKEKGVK
ncbi:MAG: helix-turn-helix transcriptional regulator [Clostridia bacterium]|nr:helix-turn-helix transcriptional regulator [Clostridia bacterium]